MSGDVDYDDDVYGELGREAQKDDRVGDHDWMITKIDPSPWPSGDARFKIEGQLLTAGGKRADLTWSPPPPPEVAKAEGKTWEKKKQAAVSSAAALAKAAKKFYGKSISDFAEGDVLRVRTVKTARDRVTGKGGFIRVIAFLDSKGVTREGKVASDVPF